MVSSYTEYAGLFIKETDHAGAAPGAHGFIVSDKPRGGSNVMPGATYFPTREAALQGIDVYRVVDGDGQKFWHLLRAINGAGR